MFFSPLLEYPSGGSQITGYYDYIPRGPIYINGNENFTEENGVIGGSGIQEDPYVISGWILDMHREQYLQPIKIVNTTAYFVIKNCYVGNARLYPEWPPAGCAILLKNVSNARIENLYTLPSFGHELYSWGVPTFLGIYNCTNVTFANTTISERNTGFRALTISIVSSSHISLLNITFLWDLSHGLGWADNPPGNIQISECINVVIRYTKLEGGGIFIRGENLSHWNTHEIDTTNTLNGKPIYYLKNIHNKTIPLDAGQVYLINCTNINVSCLHLNAPFAIVGSSNCTIMNSHFLYNCDIIQSSYLIFAYNLLRSGVDADSQSQNLFFHHNVLSSSSLPKDTCLNTSTHGNFWIEWRWPDNNNDGIVDEPFHLNKENPDLGPTDYFPLVDLPSHFDIDSLQQQFLEPDKLLISGQFTGTRDIRNVSFFYRLPESTEWKEIVIQSQNKTKEVMFIEAIECGKKSGKLTYYFAVTDELNTTLCTPEIIVEIRAYTSSIDFIVVWGIPLICIIFSIGFAALLYIRRQKQQGGLRRF